MGKYYLKRSDAKEWSPALHDKTTNWTLIDQGIFPEAKNIGMAYGEMEPGGKAEKHSHMNGHEQAVYILDGRAEMEVGEEKFEAGPDTVVFMPSGVEHDVRVIGNKSLKMLIVYSPPLPGYGKKGVGG